jgi:glutamate decarboxylase
MSFAVETSPGETPYEKFNDTIPEDHFPPQGMSARAAKATVNSEAWTDCHPVMNLSSFVTTFTEPESPEIAREHFLKNYIDHDMYPQLFTMEGRMVSGPCPTPLEFHAGASCSKPVSLW